MAIGNHNDLTHIVRTSDQWKNTYDKYELIPTGVLCVELVSSDVTKIKIGDGHNIFSKLPYIGDLDLSKYYTKLETDTRIKEILTQEKVVRIKGLIGSKSDLPAEAKCGDIYFVRQLSSSDNKYIEYIYSPDNTWEPLGGIPVDIDLSEYAKTAYVDDKIEQVNERIDDIEQHGTHTHANKDILDLITAAFTAEEKDKLSTLYNYDDTELRELITQASHTHSNKDILDAISAAFTAEDRVKLDSLTPYDDSILKEKITALERLAHEHSNKRILDRTTASFTTEYERKMRWIRLYTGCTGMEEGIAGLVPAAQAGEEDYVLSGSGEWVPQTGGGGTYELPIASASTLGGIKVGNGLEIDANGVLSTTGGGGGGDSIAEGDGITITTDPQTGVKTISVNTGDNLEVDPNTGELNVTGVDYTAGKGIFIGNEYQNVEYIKNSGNYDQIILTDIIPAYSDKLEMDIEFGAATGNTSNDAFIGCYNIHDTNEYMYTAYIYCVSDSASIAYYNHFKWTAQLDNSNMIYNPIGISYDGSTSQRMTLTLQSSSGTWGSQSANFSSAFDSNFIGVQRGIAIFGSIGTSHGSTTDEFDYVDSMELTIYGVKLYDSNDTLLHNLVPVKKLSNNEGGLYDTVTNKFYGNSGNGSFVTGPAVETDDRIINAKIGNGLQFDSNNAIEVVTGNGLQINQDGELEVNTGRALSVNGSRELNVDIATANSLGVVKAGSGLNIDEFGNLSTQAAPFRIGRALSLDDESVRLPSAYYKAKYVQSDGEARCSTEFYPSNYPNAKYVGTASVIGDTNGYKYIFGTQGDNYHSYWSMILSTSNDNQSIITGLTYNNNNDKVNNPITTAFAKGDMIDFEASITSGLKLNNELVQSLSTTFTKSTYNMFIFGEQAGYTTKARIYSFKIYNSDDTLLANFVPAVRKSDNEVGFYETVSNQFINSNYYGPPFTTDMDDLDVDEPDWVLNADIATANSLGVIKPGTGLTVSPDGTLNATPYTLPTASASTLGGVKVGDGLSIAADGTLSATGGETYEAGNGIEITEVTHEDEFRVQNQEYFFDTRGLTCGLNARVWTTVNDGDILAAMCIHNNGGNQVPLFVGLTEDSVKVSQNYDSNILGPNGSFDYRGKTWYFTADYALSGTDGQDTQNHIQTLPTTYSFSSTPSNFVPAAKDLIDLAVLLPDTLHPTISAKIGNGLRFDSNDAIEVVTGNGLSVNQDNELEINTGTGLQINQDGEVEIDPSIIPDVPQYYPGKAIDITTSADSNLPAGYAEVDYIETLGDSYTIIDYIPNRNTKIVGTAMMIEASGDPVVFGARTGNNGQQFVFWFNSYSSTQATVGFVYGTNTWSTSTDADGGKLIPYVVGDQFTFLLSLEDEFNVNGEFVHNITENGTPASIKLGIFALTISDTSIESNNNIFKGRMYEFKIYENDELVVNLVPAIYTSTGSVGFYDTIGDTFYASRTSTPFICDPSTAHISGYLVDVKYNKGLNVNQSNELEVVLSKGLEFDPNATETMVADKMYLFNSRVTCQVHTDSPYTGFPSNRTYQKTTIEPALCCLWEVGGADLMWTGPLIIGLTETSVQYTTQDTSQTVNYQNTFTYLGKTWYTSGYPDFLNGADHEDKLGHLQYLGSYSTTADQIQAAKDLIDLANVRFVSNAGIQAKLGNGLSFDANGAIQADAQPLSPATDSTLGGVIVGEGINVDEYGEISLSAGEGLDIDFESSLPPEYTLVKGISSVGHNDSPYINTGYLIKPTSRIIVRGVLYKTNSGWAFPIGVRHNNYSNPVMFCTRHDHNGDSIELWLPNDTLIASATDREKCYNDPVTIIISSDGLNIENETTGEVVTLTTSDTLPIATLPLYVFATNDNYTLSFSGPMDLYRMQIFEGTAKVLDYLPCKRNSDNKYGVYDIVANEYKASSNASLFEPVTGTPSVDDLVQQIKLLPATENTIGGVKPGDGILVDSDGTISVDPTIIPEVPTYEAGTAISIEDVEHGGVTFDAWDGGTGWENVCYQNSTGNTVVTYTYEAHSPISNSYTLPAGATHIRAIACDQNDTMLWTSFSWIDSNDYHFASTSPEDDHYDDWFEIPTGAVKVNFGVRHSKLNNTIAMSLNDIKSVNITIQIASEIEVDVWNGGSGWLNGNYYSGNSDTFTTNWYYSYHSNPDAYIPIPEGATHLMVMGISNENDSHFEGGGVNVFSAESHSNHIYWWGCAWEWHEISSDAKFVQIDVKWNDNNTRTISGSDIKSVTLVWKLPALEINQAINVKYGDGLTVNQNNELEVNLGSGLQFDANGAIEVTGGGGDTIAEGDGISITTDQQTGEKVISVDIGSGLAFDPQTGAINVTGGGDTVAQGNGINITTDQQTGDKVIAVNAGSGLSFDQTTHALEVSSGVVTSISPTPNTPGSITVAEGDGTTTPVSVISQMGGATSSTAGTAGYVPAPAAGDDDAYLRGDGTWDDSVLTEDDELTLVFVPDDYQPS